MTCMFAFDHFKSTVHKFHILPILLGTMSQTMQMKGKGCYWFLSVAYLSTFEYPGVVIELGTCPEPRPMKLREYVF